jgi:hypothetical protein
MPSFGIIDDDIDYSETLSKTIKRLLAKNNLKNWVVKCIQPFNDEESYKAWIQENEISILVIDERLFEKGSMRSYTGSKLIFHLRQIYKDLPILSFSFYHEMVQSIEKNEAFTMFDQVFDKENFEKYFPKAMRAAQAFWDNYQEQLSEISILSEKISTGKASRADINKLKSLQEMLIIPNTAHQLEDKSIWLNNFKNEVDHLGSVTEKIEKLLNKKI